MFSLIMYVLTQTPPPMPGPTPRPAVVLPAAHSEGDAKTSGRPSLVRVKCPRDCTVLLAGKTGRRLSSDSWEFEDVPPGQTRIDASGTLGMAMAAGFVTVEAASDMTFMVSGNRFAVMSTKPLTAPTHKAPDGAASVLHFNCQKPCTISIDGQRKSGEGIRTAVINEVRPGRHAISVKFLGGTGQAELTIPPASDVFLSPTEKNVSIMTSRPLSSPP
jgi:hypothetical protein